MSQTLRVAAACLLAAAAALGTARPSFAEPSAEITDITLDKCDIVVTFTAGDAGEYHLVVFDDGDRIGDVPVTAAQGASAQARYTLTAVVKQGASGLGIQIRSADDTELDSVDPYNGADDVVDFCAKQNPITTTTSSTMPPPTTTPPATAEPTTVPPIEAPEPTTPPPAVVIAVAPAAVPVDAEPTFTG
jgi:hypothetical protein